MNGHPGRVRPAEPSEASEAIVRWPAAPSSAPVPSQPYGCIAAGAAAIARLASGLPSALSPIFCPSGPRRRCS